MNGYQRIQAAIRGEFPDTTPVMLHNFMMAAREAGITMRRFREDPQAICDAFTKAVEKYEYDGILVDIDTVTLAGALGVPIDFPEDMPARSAGARLESLDEVSALPPPNIADYPVVRVWLEAVSLLRKRFGDEILVRGNCDQAPFSLASALRSPEAWMLDLMGPEKRPLVFALLDYCAEAASQFLRLMAEAGAHMLSNGDSPAGPEMISPRMYREFAQPYEKRLVEEAHRLGLPYLLHICGKTDRILAGMVETGADGLELDQKTDARLARQELDGRAAFVGNIDPANVLARGTPELVEEKTRELLEIFADTPRFVLNAGCAIPADTPPENLRAMIRVARSRTGEP